MQTILIDTNVLLRFVLADHDTLTPRANSLFAEAASGKCLLYLPDLIIAEAVWVLNAHYKVKRLQIADTLQRLITRKGIKVERSDRLGEALSLFAQTRCDFMDCYLASLANEGDLPIASFDQDFRKFKDLNRWEI